MNLVADLAELEIIIRVPQAIRPSQCQTKFFGEVGQESLVMEVRLRLRNDRLDLIELRKSQKYGREVAERLVQGTRLRSVGR